MPEGLPVPNWLDEFSAIQYKDTSLNVKSRWRVYDYAVEPMPVYETVLEKIGGKGTESVLDVGCSDGEGLVNLRLHGYNGDLIGLDIDEQLFVVTRHMGRQEGLKPVEFVAGTAQDLPIADEQIDTVLSFFMLYHVPNPEDALTEFQRVLKPGGTLAVATSGKGNKVRHRQFEKALGQHLGIDPPPRFSASFDAEKAATVLPQYFEVADHFVQSTEIHIPEEGVEDYLWSLHSMKESFKPRVDTSIWLRAIDEVVVPQMETEIREQGYFRDTVERHFFICRK